MDQNPIPNDLIVFWLRDYTHFICDQFGLPHNRAGGLLQQYLDLTVHGSPPQNTKSPYEEPTRYPAILDSHPNTPYQEQPRSKPPSSDPCNFPRSYAAPSSLRHESHIEEAGKPLNVAGLTIPDAKSQGQSLYDDEQSGDMMITDSDLPKNNPLSTQSREPLGRNSIGSVHDYDPLWVQHNNIDPAEVEKFKSPIKFEDLICYRVITVGDVLTFQVSVGTGGQDLVTEAHLKVRYQCGPKGHSSCSSN